MLRARWLAGGEIGPGPLRGFFAAWHCCLPGQPILPPRPAAAAAATAPAERSTAEQPDRGGCQPALGWGREAALPPCPPPPCQPSPALPRDGEETPAGDHPRGQRPARGPALSASCDRAAPCPAASRSPRRGHRPFVCGRRRRQRRRALSAGGEAAAPAASQVRASAGSPGPGGASSPGRAGCGGGGEPGMEPEHPPQSCLPLSPGLG